MKAVGSWTWKLRNYFDPDYKPETNPETEEPEDTPKIRIQGPFGGGNQDWYKFEVAVMIGAGIGVTPYASILNDLVFGTSTNRYSGVACKKVFFITLYKIVYFEIYFFRFILFGFAHLTAISNGSLMCCVKLNEKT